MDLHLRLARWRSWIGGPILDEVVKLVLGRQMWRQYREIVNRAPEQVRDVGGEFHRWVARNYSQSVGAAIRRQVDLRRDVNGLARLLSEMARYPRALTREGFLEGADEMHQADALRRWKDFALPDGSMLDPTYPSNDLDYLRSRLDHVRKWVNVSVAHHHEHKAKLESEMGIRFQDLHDAVDVVKEVFSRYQELLTHQPTWMEEVLTDPWDFAFSVAWLPG